MRSDFINYIYYYTNLWAFCIIVVQKMDKNTKLSDSSDLKKFLTELGLDGQEISIYLTLNKRGPLTPLQLTRQTTIPRTTIYRLLEKLHKLGIIEKIIEENTHSYQTSSVEALDRLVNEKSETVVELRSILPTIKSQLFNLQQVTLPPNTKLLFYQGQSGLRQLLWNTLQADELLGYTYLAIDNIVGKKTAQLYREERIKRVIKQRELISDNDPYLNQKNIDYMYRSPLFKNYEVRYLPTQEINIDHQISIYNHVVSYYCWDDTEIVGIEIHNRLIAKLQKEIFNHLWTSAQSPLEALRNRLRD